MTTSRREFLMAATAAAALTRPGLGATTDWGYPDGAFRVGLNENPLGPSPRALKAMAAALAQGHRYPKPQALFERLARLHGVEPEWIVLGCGSGELLRIIPPALARDGEIVTVREAYRSVPSSAERLKIPVQMVPVDAEFRHDLDAMGRAIHSGTRVVVVCNPNNPTGTVLPANAVRQFAESIPEHAVCVIDEAYIH
ncbi:MAG: aminotransferase class I/II-fold pyridoxal phosphate-dependent enzyme, partial [Gammaproteobacteria bacterium]